MTADCTPGPKRFRPHANAVSGDNSMKRSWRQPAIGTLVAIAITSAMDATGLSAFSALPLLPLLLLFGYLQRFSRAELGFTWGRRRDYALALLLPTLVLGLAALTAWMTQAVNLASTN